MADCCAAGNVWDGMGFVVLQLGYRWGVGLDVGELVVECVGELIEVGKLVRNWSSCANHSGWGNGVDQKCLF